MPPSTIGPWVPTQRTIHDVSWLVTLAKRLSGWVLHLRGWRVVGDPPSDARFVLVAAPHTSAWDVPLMLGCTLQVRLRLHWLGLATYFRWPIAGLLRWLGGVPITRGPAAQRVLEAARLLADGGPAVVAIAPEGSRHRVDRWRTGFYHLAVTAEVPLVLTALDYSKRTARFGPLLQPSGDLAADLPVIQAFYADVQGRHPERQGPIRVDEPEPPSTPETT